MTMSLIRRYTAAVLLVAAALLVSLLAAPIVRPLPSMLFLAAVLITAWWQGLGPALAATALSALAVDYFFVAPLHTIQFNEDHVVRLLTFITVACFISWLNQSLKTERQRAERKTEEAQGELRERTRVERVLRHSEAVARFQHEEIDSIYRSAPIGLCVLDTGLRITRCNARFSAIIGASSAPHEGRLLADLLPALVPPRETLARLRDHGEAIVNQEVSGEQPGTSAGSRTWVQSWSPLLTANGELRAINVVVDDVTDSRRMEQELRRASRTKDEFLATLSHELRTPLNAILGWTHLLLTGRLEDGARRRALESIGRAVRVQTVLVNDVLDLSRVVTGKLVLKREPVDVGHVIENAVSTVRMQAEAKGIQLRIAADCHATVVGDVDRLEQVVWNLLTNAIKFTPSGGEVAIEARQSSGTVEVCVEDTGVGISADFLPHLFEPFTQADGSAAREHGGLGLGLAIVKHVVEMHAGTVGAEQRLPGPGSRFTITLPTVRIDATDETPQAPVDAPREEHAAALSGLRILVVDDDEDARETTALLLSRYGATVRTEGSSEAAFTALGEMDADLIISDIGMPGVDGYDLIRRVRTLPNAVHGIPAIAVTAYGRDQDRTRALSEGYQAHVCKPIVPGALVRVVATVVRTGVSRSDLEPVPTCEAIDQE